jgi:cell division protein FtsB
MEEVMLNPATAFPIVMFALTIGLLGTVGWIYLTRLRIRHGYPLEDSWGRTVKPVGADAKLQERIAQLTAENTELKMAVADMEGRLRTLERIATDPVERLKRDIDQLN